MSNYLKLIEEIWHLNRVHISDDTLYALKKTQAFYPNSELLTYKSGETYGAMNSWEIPKKWTVKKATLSTESGQLIADYRENPLRLFSYSPSFSGIVSKQELKKHLFTNPEIPDAIPFHFRNQYRHWEPQWGFCLKHSEFEALVDDNYRVEIETEFTPGELCQLEYVKQGQTTDCFLLIGHFDHPAQCNDGLTGCIVANEVIARLQSKNTYYTYKALNAIEIIGSVAYCDTQDIESINEALFITAPGCDSSLAYQQSSQPENSIIDRIASHLLSYNQENTLIKPFRELWGNDEVAFETPGVDIRCGLLARHPLPFYHTSLDNLTSVNIQMMEETIQFVMRIIDIIENNRFVRCCYKGLPCFSHPSIDLYIEPGSISGMRTSDQSDSYTKDMTDKEIEYIGRNPRKANNLMNQISPLLASTQGLTILDIAEKTKLPFFFVKNYLDKLKQKKLIDFEGLA